MQRKQVYQLSSAQSLSLNHVQLCNPMDYSTPGLIVHHQLPEFTQTHVHQVGQVAIVKEMTGRNRAAQLAIVKQMSRQ